ncbi:hypothetical protein [Bosea sp. 685]|uniref:hypothetical protein n=1 Tax=Bosea sp. 685 TaxID=3080057 RepID=UPI0028936A4D|nr:hypothetical protein [Bosea sp. 685]WNJ89560.1 hypothetical protein RMR04_24620 [Bosea sp. 685]
MAEALDGPVGLRWRNQNVTNNARDQEKVINLLTRIPASQGGKQEAWPVPPLAGPDRGCPKFLADAIWDFQSFWKSKRVFNLIDGVVDKAGHTIRQLNSLASGAPINPPTPSPTQDTREQDIIIRFTGGPGGNRREKERENDLKENFNTPSYLATHQPLLAICYVGFREQEKFVETAVNEAIAGRTATSKGITIVIGSSAGGVSALKAACQLSARGARIKYLGINDAAFLSTSHEVNFKPFAINLNIVTGGQRINAEMKENFSQTIGHSWQFNSTSPTGFHPYAEFHGPLAGFANVDLANKPRVIAVQAAYLAASAPISPLPLPIGVRDRFAAMMHKQAGSEAENLLWARLSTLMPT